jgi:hypothetical protein
METKQLRSVRIKIFDFDNKPRDMVFTKGQKVNMGKDLENRVIQKEICNIEMVNQQRIVIYTRQKDEIQIWKDEPYNEYVSVEYENDEL